MSKYPASDLVLSVGDEEVGQLTTFDKFGSTRALVDASCYGDPWKDYVVGQQDGIEVNCEVAFDPTDEGHLALEAAYDAGDTETFYVRHADSGLAKTFPAKMTGLNYGGPKEGLLTMGFTIKIVNPGVQDESS